VAAFVKVCGGDIPTWQRRYARARDAVRAAVSSTPPDQTNISPETAKQVEIDPLPPDSPEPERPEPVELKPTSRLQRSLQLAATVVVAATIATVVTVVVMKQIDSSPAHPVEHEQTPVAAVIMVQNKVALGTSQLIEDTTPAYLSTQTRPSCASNGCEVPSTEVGSGALLVAVCHVNGTEMFNYNLDSSESKQNPNRADSTLWYRTVFPDGRSGYISEVYVAPADRGGKGLAVC
jgi:hypothetical protein